MVSFLAGVMSTLAVLMLVILLYPVKKDEVPREADEDE